MKVIEFYGVVMRLALGVDYLGKGFQGWQTQTTGPSGQQYLEEAVGFVANHPIKIIASGRTDSGVHALGQVVHADVLVERTPYQWLMGINTQLPDNIAVRWVSPVSASFHARFSALQRRYVYLISPQSAPSAVRHEHVLRVHQPLSIKDMQQAAKSLVGEHDFSAFRSSQCQAKTATRTVTHLAVYTLGENIVIDIAANAFLHHMVRNIVGSLLMVGKGERSRTWLAQVLRSQDRRQAAEKVEAKGLYLLEVLYPKHHDLPSPDLSLFGWDFRHFALSHDRLAASVLTSPHGQI